VKPVPLAGSRPDSPALTALETAVIDCALRALGADGAALRAQLEVAEVRTRTGSGVGFVTRLRVPADTPRAAGRPPPPVLGHHPALAEPAEFLLELKDGRLHTLEACCFSGFWPDDEAAFQLVVRS